MRRVRLLALVLAAVFSTAPAGGQSQHYSPLQQIHRDNVKDLAVAWTYDTGDSYTGSEMQCTPLLVDGVLYIASPKVRIVALNAATGKQLWSFDPWEGKMPPGKYRTRGLTYWQSGKGSPKESLIYFVTLNTLWALNPRTGRPSPTFGSGGRINLLDHLGRDGRGMAVSMTSPGVVYKDLLIIGSLVSETLPSMPGDIRAYDARTGQLRWSFHTIPHPGELGYNTWPPNAWTYIGGVNDWSGMTLDSGRGLVFVPTGSAAFDFYGANRRGDNLFANCLIALKAETGQRVWHFQTVHHDLWDRDLPAPPTLLRVQRGGEAVDAVAQITKSGYVFLFNRDTGAPLFPIEERKVPTAVVDGETPSPTQPVPTLPPPFARQFFDQSMVTDRTPEAHAAVLEKLRTLKSAGQFLAPSKEGSIIFPGLDGGGEWGGAAWDPETGFLYLNSNEMAWILALVKQSRAPAKTGRGLYKEHCATCHRSDMRGAPPSFPSLVGIGKRVPLLSAQILVRNGSGRMPGFSTLPWESTEAILQYVYNGKNLRVKGPEPPHRPNIDQKYRFDGYKKFLDPDDYPAVKPPWGTLSAIDLNKGEIAWTIPFGEYPELAAAGLKNTGSENYGGAVATAGGLLFIGATNFDKKFHAFDKVTGNLLWEAKLPAAGNSTPLVYEAKGRQYVVIAAGGGKSAGAPSGGSYVAFALAPATSPQESAKSAKAKKTR